MEHLTTIKTTVTPLNQFLERAYHRSNGGRKGRKEPEGTREDLGEGSNTLFQVVLATLQKQGGKKLLKLLK
jgi:hypothetical protein